MQPLAETGAAARFKIVVLMPVFKDWDVASKLCQLLDEWLSQAPDVDASVLMVDDGSPRPLEGWTPFEPQALTSGHALLLHRNLGHQRAIAMGLCHVHESFRCDAVVVMDADGEDRPQDVLPLLDRAREGTGDVVFAERRKRWESPVFRSGYWLYRKVHRLLTGVPVRVGNFSVIPAQHLPRLVCSSELWNHYAGAVFKSRLPYARVPTDRGTRLGGRSHMDLIALVIHGISGLATFQDVVVTRIFIAALFGSLGVTLAIAFVVAIRLTTDLAIPGWATFTAGLLVLLLVQLGSVMFGVLFSIISSRTQMPFIPIQEYGIFVRQTQTMWDRTT